MRYRGKPALPGQISLEQLDNAVEATAPTEAYFWGSYPAFSDSSVGALGCILGLLLHQKRTQRAQGVVRGPPIGRPGALIHPRLAHRQHANIVSCKYFR